MSSNAWAWAHLEGAQLDDLKEAERTLGARVLLAYQADQMAKVQGERFPQSGLKVAPLNESQVECLVGLESKIKAVVIAYQ
jgi:hypothetical protein